MAQQNTPVPGKNNILTGKLVPKNYRFHERLVMYIKAMAWGRGMPENTFVENALADYILSQEPEILEETHNIMRARERLVESEDEGDNRKRRAM